MKNAVKFFGRVAFFDNVNCLDLTSSDALWQDWKDRALTENEIVAIGDVLEERWTGVSKDVSVFSAGMDTPAYAQLGLNPEKPVWTLYTSSLDETIDEPRSTGAFDNQYDWINATIEYVSTRPDVQLVVRVHPNVASKSSLGQNPQDMSYFVSLPEKCPDNVTVVPSESLVSSYSLAAESDLGLIWRSTIGLEMAALGQPVLRVGENWLSPCDFMLSARSPGTHQQQLDGFSPNLSHAGVMKRAIAAWRFAYVWYFRRSFPFPLVNQPEWYRGEPNWTSLDDLREGQDETLDHICSVIAENAPLYPPAESRPASLADAEQALIWERIMSHRSARQTS